MTGRRRWRGAASGGPAAALVEQRDRLSEDVSDRCLHALASVFLLRGEPRVVALDGEAQDPVVSELLLELVHLVLEGGRLLAFRVLRVVGFFVVGFGADFVLGLVVVGLVVVGFVVVLVLIGVGLVLGV